MVKTDKVRYTQPHAKVEASGLESLANFMRRLMAVPHAEIKANLNAEKKAKARKPKRASASRA